MLTGCAGMSAAPAPTQQNFKAPVVTLDSMEVVHAFGYWYFSKKVEPTKGKPDNVGARLIWRLSLMSKIRTDTR